MTRRHLLLAMGAAAGANAHPARPAAPDPEPASLAARLGFGKEDRLLILHADDIGMCHSVNAASTEALTRGVVSSGSVMVPCPWFPEIAAWAREHPEADLGLHLTLTSEWRHYRWRPVAPAERVPGLVDEEGFLWRSVAEVRRHAKPEEVELEIRAQIDRARKFGMRPTHVDSHMGTLFADPRFFDAYVRVARETKILPMLPGPTPETLAEARKLGLDYAAVAGKLREQGFLLLDRLVTGLDGSTFEERKAALEKFIGSLQPGVTQLIVHLSGDDPEIRSVTGNWRPRFHEYRLTTDREVKARIAAAGVKLIGYRPLAELWNRRANQPARLPARGSPDRPFPPG